ncbi:MAG TPA: M50 family metallopeptidase [Caulobacterales bacterium]|nr:M50 family metallopeptidase [Caulobacterales bacterium]
MAEERGLRIGSFAGAAIVVDPTVLILALYVLATGIADSGIGGVEGALIFLAALMLTVLLHEFGHAGVAALLKLPSKRIVLTFFGGHVEFAWPPKSRWQEIAVSFAGPAANLLTCAALIAIGSQLGNVPDRLILFLSQLAYTSLILGVFNLLPGFPLDGGRILRAILNYFMSLDRARMVAGACGILVAVALGAWALMHGLWWSVMIALFLALAAWGEIQSARAAIASGQPSAPEASSG